jgi:hypothetical protein
MDTTNFEKVKESFQSLLEHVFIFYTYLQIIFSYKYIPSHHNIYIYLFILLFGFYLL